LNLLDLLHDIPGHALAKGLQLADNFCGAGKLNNRQAIAATQKGEQKFRAFVA
jgi:hypothetical protein